MNGWGKGLLALGATFVGLGLLANVALAAPEARLLRIDPQTSLKDGNPTLTAIIDVSDLNRTTQLTSACSGMTGEEQTDCIAAALEQPDALAKPVSFDQSDLKFAIKVDGQDQPVRLLSTAKFGQSQGEPRVGTAYLLIIDADSHGGKAFDEAQAVAKRFISSMGPNDWVDVVYLGPSSILSDTGWLPLAKSAEATTAVDAQEKTVSSRDRTRPLLDLIKQAATESFRSLSTQADSQPPLHQATVILSSGYGGGDPSTTGPGATQLSQFFTAGRLDANNTALPKLPLPLISIYLPPTGAMAEHQQLARSFMENLANPEIGGFYTILRDGQADHAPRIVDTVRTRFAHMIVARFALSCVAPKTTQSFTLLFKSGKILGDSSFSDVPVGFDPSEWPLDVDAELTRQKAEEGGGVYPGGRLKVLGRFCWGSDVARPEIYFIPPGESLPRDLSDPEAAANVQKRLVSLDMRGRAVQANESFAEFEIPATEQILHGEGERKVVRVVVVDSQQHRTSGILESNVLTLKGQKRPLPTTWIIALSFAGVVVLLLLLVLIRSGSKRATVAKSHSRLVTEESPYATPAPVSRVPKQSGEVGRATLEGAAGRFVVLAGTDLRVGRDASRCAAVIAHAQVSGLHATFRLEGGALLVRDEGSTSGTRVDGTLLSGGKWETIPDGGQVSLGPERFRVSIEKTPS